MNTTATLSLGQKLYQWRTYHQLSQGEVARLLNCSRRTVIAWEHDEKLPGYDFIIALALLMDVSSDWLLGMEAYRRS